MNLRTLNLALSSMKKNRLRASLTMFGITIGIAMVIIVLSAGSALKELVKGQLASFGDDWVNIEIKIPDANHRDTHTATTRGVVITTLTTRDQDAINKLGNVKTSYSGITSQAVTSYRDAKRRANLFGVSAAYLDIDKTGVADGRFFTDEEDKSLADVAVLGSEIKDQLFGNSGAVGKRVKIGTRSYEVIGVMNKKGVTGFFNMDTVILLPLQTTQKKIMGIDHVLWIIAQLENSDKSASSAEEIHSLMREQHNIKNEKGEDFSVTTMQDALETINVIFTGVTWLLIALSAISLLVGGVGIMNVMYVSVAERTFEIGLRKAVGASSRAILQQFLAEAVTITFVGGLIGVASGVIISWLISFVATKLGLAWTFSMPHMSILISTGFSTATGLIFGLYPAQQAAKLDPIEAIRAE